jgi:DNA-binding response OmpR family regulator
MVAQILLIEDESLLRWSLVRRLEKEAHQVAAAENLAQANQSLDQGQPALMILDLILPDGNGFDFLEQNLDRLAGTAVLVVTADGCDENRARASRLGAKDLLTKPVEHQVLVNLVNQLVDIHSPISI